MDGQKRYFGLERKLENGLGETMALIWNMKKQKWEFMPEYAGQKPMFV